MVIINSASMAQSNTLYGNSRFGFSFSYPKYLVADRPPDNGDGICLRNKRGLVITASGMHNANEETLESEMNERRKDFDEVVYEKKGKNWFVLSGFKGDKILYDKIFLGLAETNSIRFEYPRVDKKLYDKIVSSVVQSFKPGSLDEPVLY